MANTPEGKIKKKVSAYLRTIDGLWYTMPVPGGYGQSTLDYLCCYRGWFFSIETKAPGKKPTDRQHYLMEDIRHAGGTTFVVDDDHFNHLRRWIGDVAQAHPGEEGSHHISDGDISEGSKT